MFGHLFGKSEAEADWGGGLIRRCSKHRSISNKSPMNGLRTPSSGFLFIIAFGFEPKRNMVIIANRSYLKGIALKRAKKAGFSHRDYCS